MTAMTSLAAHMGKEKPRSLTATFPFVPTLPAAGPRRCGVSCIISVPGAIPTASSGDVFGHLLRLDESGAFAAPLPAAWQGMGTWTKTGVRSFLPPLERTP